MLWSWTKLYSKLFIRLQSSLALLYSWLWSTAVCWSRMDTDTATIWHLAWLITDSLLLPSLTYRSTFIRSNLVWCLSVWRSDCQSWILSPKLLLANNKTLDSTLPLTLTVNTTKLFHLVILLSLMLLELPELKTNTDRQTDRRHTQAHTRTWR